MGRRAAATEWMRGAIYAAGYFAWYVGDDRPVQEMLAAIGINNLDDLRKCNAEPYDIILASAAFLKRNEVSKLIESHCLGEVPTNA